MSFFSQSARLGLWTMAAVACLHAQTATMTGIVKNNTGSALNGAKVSLSVLGLTTQTSSDGKFSFSGITSAAVGFRAHAVNSVKLQGTKFNLTIASQREKVSLELFDLAGRNCKTLINRELQSGAYVLDAASAQLPASMYVAKIRIGTVVNCYTVSLLSGNAVKSLGCTRSGNASGILSKQAIAIIDTIVVDMAGYGKSYTPIAKYASDYTIVLDPKATAVNTKIFSERAFAQIDWGKTNVQVWDNAGGPSGTQLNGSYPDAFEGAVGWKAVCGYGFSVWVFRTANPNGVDMSAFEGGYLHVAVKGSVPSLGMFVTSVGSQNPRLDLSTLGYSDDGKWHELKIPLTSFGTIDLSKLDVYCGFAAPAVDNGDYAAGLSYVIDDLYFMPK